MADAQTTLLWIYVLVGPLAWVLMFVGFGFGYRRMTRLLTSRAALPADPPHVTILVPAKDEAEGIRRCIENVLAQDYPKFRVIAVDDRSADETGGILDELAQRHPSKLRIVHIAPGTLPDGWLGKCNALWTASREADGQWLLLVDSDVTIAPDALSKVLALALARRYDTVSILTTLECHTFWERLILPLAACTWTVMYTASLTNEESRPTIAVANGQFFLIRREAYETVGGHAAVRDQITEDVELMRAMKGRGYRVRLMLGAHLASTRMHRTLRQMFHGWARIFCGTSRRRPGRILAAAMFYVLSGFSVYVALAAGLLWRDAWWVSASVAHFVLIGGYLAMIYRMSGNAASNALLFPVSGAAMLGIFAFALHTCRTGRVNWRDTQFTAPPGVTAGAPAAATETPRAADSPRSTASARRRESE